MKKILNRVMAAAIAVPMVLTQGAIMNISAEDASAKTLSLDTFTAIPADKIESEWNTKMLAVATSMEGTQKEITKDDFLAMLPENNSYAVMAKEIMDEAANPVLTVKDGIVTVKATADMTNYAESKVYSKVRKALAKEGYTGTVTMDAFNKTVEFTVSFDANALESGKEIDVECTLTSDGTDIGLAPAAYFKGLAKELADSVAAQVDVVSDDVANALNIELLAKLDRAQELKEKAADLNKSGSYATADEMLAAVSKYVAKKTKVYTVPASVDEAVQRHGSDFNKVVDLLNDIVVTNGYTLNVTANDVAALAKEGSNFEVIVSNGTYAVSFQISDAEAAEVEEYVNANAEEGKAYDSSYKIVEARGDINDGVAYFDVKREIILKDVEITTTTTTTTTSDSTTTTTTTSSSTSDSTTTTTTVSTSDTSDSTTTTTTVSTSDTSDTTDSIVPVDFILESIEVEAGKGYYFSHDENAFDLAGLVNSLTLVGTLHDEAYTVKISPTHYNNYLKPAFATPADYFNSVEGTAYVASELKLTFVPGETMNVADNADLTVTDNPIVYIGVKGDTDLSGHVEIADATLVLTYYGHSGVGQEITLNDDEDLNVLAYFLADVDTESKAGKNSNDGRLDISDATNILTYYGKSGAGQNPVWSEIIG
ncbi:MAG: hypothetical protein K2H01_10075 [Ruminococcus sp.]|nr:hypothetical protein [Ruminococcus sp.]